MNIVHEKVATPVQCEECGDWVHVFVVTRGRHSSIETLCGECALEVAELRRFARVIQVWEKSLTGLAPEQIAAVA